MEWPGPGSPAALPLPVERARARDAARTATARRSACWGWRPISPWSTRDARVSWRRREVGMIVAVDGKSERHPVEVPPRGQRGGAWLLARRRVNARAS